MPQPTHLVPPSAVRAPARAIESLQCRVDIEISESGINTLPRGQLRGVICYFRAKSGFGGDFSLRCLFVDCGGLHALDAVQFPAPPPETPAQAGGLGVCGDQVPEGGP